MAIAYRQQVDPDTEFALWKIEEGADELYNQLQLNDHEKAYIDTLSNGKRNLHWLGTRVLLRKMLQTDHYIDCQVDSHGKPYLVNIPYHISLSHSYDYAAVMVSKSKPVGIDIEQVKEKVERIAHKFMRPEEMGFLNPAHKIDQLYVCWCAKEAVYKCYGQKEVSFVNNIHLDPFDYDIKGGVSARLIKEDVDVAYNVNYMQYEDYMVGFCEGIIMKNKQVLFEDWGLIDYKEAWDKQEAIFADTVNTKIAIRNLQTAAVGGDEPAEELSTKNHLIFCEHPHVYTLGKSGKPEHLLLDEQGLKDKHAVYYPINRGGDITYHGPGQIVSYPILDLDNFFTDIHLYLRTLEDAVMLTMAEFGLKGERYPGYTGVWLDADNDNARKICAMGVRCSRWVTMHGLAFNVNTDLDYFKNIVPCGIDDKAVTSMQHELGAEINIEQVKKILKHHISVLFNMEIVE